MNRLLLVLALPCSGAVSAADKAAPVAPESLAPGSALQVVVSLLLVVALIIGMAWLLRRFGTLTGSGGNGPLRVIASVAVGQRERVVLLQAGDRQLLLGVAPGRVQTLQILDEPLPMSGRDDGENFLGRLNAALKSRRGQ